MCNKDTYTKRFDIVKNIKDGGTLLLNTSWSVDDMETKLPASLRRAIAQKKLKLYNLDAFKIARQEGLGVRINTIMLTAYLYLAPVIPFDDAFAKLKALISTTYAHEGNEVVNKNLAAIESAVAAITPIDYPAEWINATDEPVASDEPAYIKNVATPCMKLEGDALPVSAFSPDGTMPMGTTAYEKRTIALNIPEWDLTKCVECTLCSFVCAHASIRPYLLDAEEKSAAPAAMATKDANGKAFADNPLQWRIQVFPEDCTGCGSCAVVCPGHALTMMPIATQIDEQKPLLAYAQNHVSIKDNILPRNTVNGSQMFEPMLQFSGACAGCGETPYVKLLTQLMGERTLIANATGCSSIWGANFPSNAYCTNRFGQGPAWGNSLFEDNAEYGFGMAVAIAHRRQRITELATATVNDPATSADVKTALQAWLNAKDNKAESAPTGKAAVDALKQHPETAGAQEMIDGADLFAKKSVWIIGGDGWAYDIGFGGLDHVIAQNIDVNVLVMDTECYSNTGGQTSKATPLGAVAKYASDGKRTFKKDLGRMMMTYGNVYVASIALGANYQQAVDAFVEADAYNGPALVIAYCPCIEHGIRVADGVAGMSNSIVEEKKAVECGYWQIYRFNPAAPQGQPQLTVDYQKPDDSMPQFLDGEDRYADLKMLDPEEAAVLRPELQTRCDNLFDLLTYDTSAPRL